MRAHALLRLLLLLPLTLLAVPVLPAAALDGGADGRFEKRSSSHFVLHQDVDIDRRSGFRGSVRFERQVLDTLESAHDRLGELLGLHPTRPIDVWIYDPAIFDSQFGGVFRFPIAGFYHGAIRVRGDAQLTNRLFRVLHHELLHAALDQEARLYAPPGWVNEGLAEWFEHRAAGKRRMSPGEWSYLATASAQGYWIPEDWLMRRTLAAIPPDAVGLAYLQSYARIDFLDRRLGPRGLARFIAALLRLGDVDRALARVYRLSVVDLDAALRAELH